MKFVLSYSTIINSELKTYLVYKISTNPFLPDIISGLLWELDISGLTEEENYLNVFIPGLSKVTEEQISELLNHLKEEKMIETFSVEKIIQEEKNWNEIWEKGREVIRVTEKLVIKPSFKEYTGSEDEIVITIDPRMSFGTGEHQTTKLVLRILEKNIEPGMKVLDVGSGTGILSIASVKLGASHATAIDNDEICFENCKENCEINSVSGSVNILTGEIKDIADKNFDMIIANIQKNVLIDITGEIKEKLKEKSKVILSGLLKDDVEEILKKYSSLGFTLIQKELMDEWLCLVFSLTV